MYNETMAHMSISFKTTATYQLFKLFRTQIEDFFTNLGEITKMSFATIYYMFKGTILNYVTNDVIEGVREAFFKEYNIKIENRTPKAKRVHCLKASSYKFTTEKIAKLMQLALLNHSKNIINDRILFLFELFINLEEKTKQEEYKKITKKHIKQAFKEMLEEDNKTETLACCTMSHAEEIMQEMGWFSIE